MEFIRVRRGRGRPHRGARVKGTCTPFAASAPLQLGVCGGDPIATPQVNRSGSDGDLRRTVGASRTRAGLVCSLGAVLERTTPDHAGLPCGSTRPVKIVLRILRYKRHQPGRPSSIAFGPVQQGRRRHRGLRPSQRRKRNSRLAGSTSRWSGSSGYPRAHHVRSIGGEEAVLDGEPVPRSRLVARPHDVAERRAPPRSIRPPPPLHASTVTCGNSVRSIRITRW